ncbi:MAG: M56 family metallopeptidase, partial [Bacteroidota bacterium]
MAAGWHEAASGLFITVAGASVKGSFLIGPLILVVFFLRRLSAALRSSLLASAFCGLLFLTIVPVTGRHIRWSISLPVRHAMHTPVSGTSPAITGKGEIGQPASATAVSAETQAPPRRGWDIVAVLGLVWAAGCLIGLFQLGGGYCSLRRLRKKAVTVSDHPWREEAIQSAAALGLRRRIGLVFAERLETPATCGVSRPLVLLPAAAASWPEGCRRMVLLHELSHVKRYDVLWRTLARLIAAVHWFNPLVWLALRELLAAQEEACDSHVLEGGVAAGDYARHLLAMLRPPGRRIVSCPGAVDGIVRFERRIRTIMSWTKRNTRWKPLHYGILSVVFLACVLLGGVGVRADDAPEDAAAVNGPSLLALPFSG